MRTLVNINHVETVKMGYDKIRAVHVIIFTLASGEKARFEYADKKEAEASFERFKNFFKNNVFYDNERK